MVLILVFVDNSRIRCVSGARSVSLIFYRTEKLANDFDTRIRNPQNPIINANFQEEIYGR